MQSENVKHRSSKMPIYFWTMFSLPEQIFGCQKLVGINLVTVSVFWCNKIGFSVKEQLKKKI